MRWNKKERTLYEDKVRNMMQNFEVKASPDFISNVLEKCKKTGLDSTPLEALQEASQHLSVSKDDEKQLDGEAVHDESSQCLQTNTS